MSKPKTYEELYKDREAFLKIQELRLLDKQLEQVDVQLNFHVSQFAFELTGSRLQDNYGNKKLWKLGCENQHYSLKKVENECEMQVCGWTIGSYEKLSELYSSGLRSHTTLLNLGNDILRRMSQDEYMKLLLREVQKCKTQSRIKKQQDLVRQRFEESKGNMM